MHADRPTLERIAQLDAESDKLTRDLTVARGAVEATRTAERLAIEAREKAAADDAAAHTEERALNRKIEEYKLQMAAANRVLETGVGNTDAAERQLEKCAAILDETETKVLELLEREDATKALVKAADAKLAEARAARAEAEKLVPDRIKSLESELAVRAAEHAKLRDALHVDQRTRYDLLRPKKKSIISKVVGGDCTGCQMSVGAQVLAEVKRGDLLQCRGCGRWLTA